jgi:uncharacterized membrane protein YdjX (TVP38/TMEM64 family)
MRAEGSSDRSVAIAACVLGAVTLLGFIAPLLPGASPDMLRLELASVAKEWWAPIMGAGLFTVLASLGAPQIVLITALVLVFGGPVGFACSMAGKLLACALGFLVGRAFGTKIIRRYETRSLTRVMRWLSRHGFWASAVVRLVPTVPSVIVNIAAGTTPMRFSAFLAGTAIGSVPKMLAIALGGQAAAAALQGRSVGAWAAVGAAAVIWLAIAVAGRRILHRWRDEDACEAETAPAAAADRNLV